MPKNDFRKAYKYIFVSGFDIYRKNKWIGTDTVKELLPKDSVVLIAGEISIKSNIQRIADTVGVNPEEIRIKPTIRIFDLEEGRHIL